MIYLSLRNRISAFELMTKKIALPAGDKNIILNGIFIAAWNKIGRGKKLIFQNLNIKCIITVSISKVNHQRNSNTVKTTPNQKCLTLYQIITLSNAELKYSGEIRICVYPFWNK